MFKYKNKELKNDEVQNIAVIAELGEEFKNNDWKFNEKYAREQLVENKIKTSLSIECPIDDLVYFQPIFEGETAEGYYVKTEKDYELLKNLFYAIQNCFKGKVVAISVHSDLISDEANEFPMSFEEFSSAYALD